MERRFDGVIFDLFGTLIDGPKSAQAEMADAIGVDPDEFRTAWSRFRRDRDGGRFATVEAEIEAALGYLGAEADSESVQAAKAIRHQSVRESLEPRPGAVELLQALRSKGYALGLLSNCARVVPELWNQTAFSGLFDVTVFSARERLLKPDEAIFRRAVEGLGVAPERCLYIGDGDSDELDGAAAIGMTPWLLLMPHEDPPWNERHAASADRWRHLHLRSLAQVLDVLADSA